MKYKLERLETTEGKRIIIIGGSNVPFALKSEILEKHFPEYEIVDFGMYADLGTVIMLDWAKTEIHKGDIFILMPEQSQQTLSCYFSGESVWQAVDGAEEMLFLLPFKRYEKLLSSFPVYAGKKMFYAINGAPDPENIYARSSFNSYGDISYSKRQYNIMTIEYNPNDLILFSPDIIQDEFLTEINEFASIIQEKGASIYYHFPPMNQKALKENTKISDIDSYYNYLQDEITFPIIGNPHNCLMESGWFYDTNYHLNDSGALVFTQMLIEDLKVVLLDTSPTEIATISIPEIPTQNIYVDNSCIDCFSYTKENDGWYITGFTPKGASATSLILPVSYQDEIISGICPDLFHENHTLVELTIQNSCVLYDAMFQGCTSFRKLILKSEVPSDYIVGDALLDDANFSIYVPENSVDTYRRHYSWQEYAEYLFADTFKP